jgi:signal transduction histidine kinase
MDTVAQKNSCQDEALKNFLNNTLKDLMRLTSAECGSLFLFDSANNELVLNSFYNSGNLSINGLRKKLGDGISGTAAGIQRPILVKDIGLDSRFTKNGFTHYKTNSFMAIPLFSGYGLLGLINLADKSNQESFSEKDLDSATTLVKYASLAIDNTYSDKYASMGNIAAGVAHEINNPLDGALRYANILIQQLEANSIAKEYLLELKGGLNRIATITKSPIFIC